VEHSLEVLCRRPDVDASAGSTALTRNPPRSGRPVRHSDRQHGLQVIRAERPVPVRIIKLNVIESSDPGTGNGEVERPRTPVQLPPDGHWAVIESRVKTTRHRPGTASVVEFDHPVELALPSIAYPRTGSRVHLRPDWPDRAHRPGQKPPDCVRVIPTSW
jgi:hypothetical protein